ncbi:MAG: response regulator [Blastocatellia bacterium]
MSAASALRYAAIVTGGALAASLQMAAAGAWPGPFGGIPAPDGFMGHWHCHLWEPWLIRLHVGSDSLIGASYVAISATLAYLVSRARRDMPFQWVFLAFGLFIVACGATHFMEVWTVWTPVYWLAGDIKLITAVASAATAVVLPPLVPKVLDVIKAAKLSEERGLSLETANEELARLYGEVRRLDELKTDFFAGVSHELRTPLTLIPGPARKLKASERLTAAERPSLEVIESNANILPKHVNDLLDVSRLDAGGPGVSYAEVDLARLVRLAAANFEMAAADDRVAFADGSTTRLYGGLAIARHLAEMHGGTLQAASPGEGRGSTFTVDLPLMMSEGSRGAGNNDAGKDLEPQRPAPSGPSDGAGSEGLEGDRNYTVNADSGSVASPPRDTRPPASRYGPLSRDEGDVPPLADGEDPCDNTKSLEGLRLLVVDDEPDTRDMLNAALRQCGADVRASASAGEAVEELQRWRPHVIVADIGMPVEDGYDMIQRIRKLGPEQGGRTPAIALTAYARAEDRERALMAGYQEHIPKPVEPDDLVEAIAKLAGRNRGQ